MAIASILRPLTQLVPAEAIDFWLQHVDPLASVERVRARVLAVNDEIADVRTFTLQPNANWKGFRAGQHVIVSMEIDGRRLSRPFSLAGAENDPCLRLTIGRRPGGRVTGWMHDHLRPGAIVELGAARGAFVLPDDRHLPVLLIAGGTGVTPCLAMLRTLAARREPRDLTLLYYARDARHMVANAELDTLVERIPGAVAHRLFTSQVGHFTPEQLARHCPDFRARRTLVCGPTSLMLSIEQEWPRIGLADRLQREWFGLPHTVPPTGEPATVSCTTSGRTLTLPGARSLLEELEAAGLRPRHGCRAGICHECTCLKTAGTVVDLRTGARCGEAPESIQLCAVRAEGPLALSL
jgi:stearoyl-CoA 9-desaturase NADPH oxidoreductase